MVSLENRGAPHRSRAPGHLRSCRCGPTYCGVPEKNFEILLGRQKILFVIHFLFFSRFFFKQQVPKTHSCVFFFRLAFEKFKSSFLFFLWAEAETRKSVYLKSGLRRAFWSKIGPQNNTHVVFFYSFGAGWKMPRTCWCEM